MNIQAISSTGISSSSCPAPTIAPTVAPAAPATYAEFLKNTIRKGTYQLYNKSAFGGATTGLTFTREVDFFNILIHLLNSHFLSKPSKAAIAATSKGCHRFIQTYTDLQTFLFFPTPRYLATISMRPSSN